MMEDRKMQQRQAPLMERDESMFRQTVERQRNLLKLLNTLDCNSDARDETLMNPEKATPNDETQGINNTQICGLQEVLLVNRSPQGDIGSGQMEGMCSLTQSTVIDDIVNRRGLGRQESVSSLDSNKIRKNVRRASRKRPSSQLPLRTEMNLETPIIFVQSTPADATPSAFCQ